MMGTLAKFLADRKIRTKSDLYRAEVTGDIEEINGVLKITRIHVDYYRCIAIEHRLSFETL
ncbi:MAG: hypothetical protein P8175_00375 [Deltaproteobacteria bacterium]